jgi:hypothetical protein
MVGLQGGKERAQAGAALRARTQMGARVGGYVPVLFWLMPALSGPGQEPQCSSGSVRCGAFRLLQKQPAAAKATLAPGLSCRQARQLSAQQARQLLAAQAALALV